MMCQLWRLQDLSWTRRILLMRALFFSHIFQALSGYIHLPYVRQGDFRVSGSVPRIMIMMPEADGSSRRANRDVNAVMHATTTHAPLFANRLGAGGAGVVVSQTF